MKKNITLSIVACALIGSLTAKNEPTSKASISFQENKGQICDQYSKPRTDVLYSGSGNGLTYHLTKNGVSYQLSKVDKWNEIKAKNSTLKTTAQSTIYRVDIKWLGINENSSITKGQALDGFNNYYLAQCPKGALNVKSYSDITYNNIYNGIDLKWYDNNGTLEYDYILSPNADATQIKFEIKGATALKITKNGELEITTPLGKVIEKAPIAYQGETKIKTEWNLVGNQISFKVADYNHSQPLVIDPMVRLWGTYYGATGDDYLRAVVNDATGNVYATGNCGTSTGTLIATTGAYQTVYGGSTADACLVKFNSSGVRQFGTYYGGTGVETGLGCAFDATNNMIYISGYTNSSAGIATAGAHQTTKLGAGATNDAFLAKFNLTGAIQWATYYGGSLEDYGSECAVDGTGNVYLTGNTASATTTNIATAGSHQTAFGGGATDAFIAKFSTAGVRSWGTYFGSTGNEDGASCTADAAGNIYVTGSLNLAASVTAMTTAGAHQTTYGGLSDAYLAKFNTSGVRQWCTAYGGPWDEKSYSCDLDAGGNIYIAGNSYGLINTTLGIIATAGAHQTTALGGAHDAFLVKFNSLGVRQWGTLYGANGDDNCTGVKVDASGYIYLIGYTDSNVSIATIGGYQTTGGGTTEDGFLIQFNGFGTRQWGTYYGGTGVLDYAYDCSFDATGNVFLCGVTAAPTTTLIASAGSHQSTFGGGTYDGYLAKFSLCGYLSLNIAGTSTLCAGNSATLAASGSTFNTYSWSTSSTSTLITVSPTTTTTYTLNATSVANPSCVYYDVQTVSVSPTPTITTSGNATICPGTSTNVTASGASSYTWNPGALVGNSVLVNPTVQTTYTVTGTNAGGCTNTNTLTMYVYTTPTITVTSPSICAGKTATVVASGSGVTTYSWSTGSFFSNITVSPALTTTYTVIGYSANSCSSTVMVSTVTVVSNPTVSVANATTCSGSSVTLNASGASTYSWNTGATTNTISVSPISLTVYTVTGTSAAGCTNIKTATVSVNANPALTVNTPTICSGATTTLTANGATSYSWSTSASTSSIAVSPTTTINYTVVGTGTNSCSSSKTATVVVNPLPNVAVASTTICSGSTGTLAASGASTYTWNTGANGANLSVNPVINTNYTVTGTSAFGCVKSATASVTVGSAPSIAVSDQSVCAGTTATLVASGVSTYTWSTSSNSSSITVTPPVGINVYTVTGNLVGCTSAAVKTVTVTVNALPTVNLAPITALCVTNASVTLSGSPAGGIYSGTGVSGNGFNPAVSGAGTFTITYFYTDANSCSASAIQTASVSLCTGIETLNASSNSIHIYPNPVSESENVNIILDVKADLQIIDILGKSIMSVNLNQGNNTINIADLSSGIYYFEIKSENKKMTQKVIKN